ncbi:hypothetical protein, partial [Segatella buccae]|uniref:hypothetical protein n=1 Tax=Segatella buccae TaxID=28126 RepID=UPI0028D19722
IVAIALFLPFKKKADATVMHVDLSLGLLFLPFKKKADATHLFKGTPHLELFLPFKKKADATPKVQLRDKG